MRKYCFLLFTISLFPLISCGKKQPSLKDLSAFPAYDSVVHTALKSYNLEGETGKSFYLFARKPDGWYIVEQNIADGRIQTRDFLFWSASSKTFEPVRELPKFTQEAEWLSNYYLQQYYVESFETYPYFGYVGYIDDNLKLLEKNKSSLSDSLLYALGKCYTTRANEFIIGQYGHADTNLLFFKDKGYHTLNDEQTQIFLEWEKKSIAVFTEILEKNPEFATTVGTIQTKRDNEIVFAYYCLRMFGRDAEAKEILQDGLYNPVLLDIAKNGLRSCDSLSFYFFNADTDFFTALYAQEKFGVRNDVKILHAGMLQIPQCLAWAQQQFRFQLPFEVYTNPAWRAVCSRQRETVPFAEIAVSIENAYNNGIVAEITGSQVEFANGLRTAPLKENPLASDIMLLDLIYSNPEFPVAFGLFFDEYQNPFGNYKIQDGLVYKPTQLPAKTFDKLDITTTSSFRLLLRDFTYTAPADAKIYSEEPTFHFITGYKLTFSKLAENYILQNDPDSARAVMNTYFSKFPAAQLHADASDYQVFKVCKQLEMQPETELLKEQLKTYIQAEREKLKKKNMSPSTTLDFLEKELERN